MSPQMILLVGHDAKEQGAQRVLLEIARWLVANTDFRIRILLFGSGHLISQYQKVAKVRVAENWQFDVLLALAELIDEPPDVVFCNTIVSGRLFWAGLPGILQGSRFICYCHEMEGNLLKFQTEVSLLKRHVRHWICVTELASARLIDRFGVPPTEVSIVPAFISPSNLGGLDRNFFRSQERVKLGICMDQLVVIGCGSVDDRKDPNLFILTAMELPHAVFVWIGEGELLTKLCAEVQSIGLAPRIKFVGRQQNAADLVCIGDIFFLSSKEDPYPLVVLEAGSHGLPCVCFAGATGLEPLLNRGCGLIIEQREPACAARTLSELATNVTRRKILGETSQSVILAEYTTSVRMPAILASIKSL